MSCPLVPSSSGLGHGPLKAKTRVQISLGSPIKSTPLRGSFFICIHKHHIRFEYSFIIIK